MQRAHGFSDWMWQRLTAATMAIYSVLVLVYWLLFRVASLLFFWALMYHAWLGLREIMMDYVHHALWRSRLEWLVRAALLGYAVWALVIVWSIK
jgi:succinate dehydrogenase / fumarate reductase, membrane anchor subunit